MMRVRGRGVADGVVPMTVSNASRYGLAGVIFAALSAGTSS
jgi:hypothetical protein